MDGTSQRSPIEILRAVWPRRRALALLVFASGAAAAVAASLALPNLYRATATVLVEGDQMSQSLVRPTVTGALDTRLETMTQRVLSRERLSQLVQRFGLYPSKRPDVSVEAKIDRMRRDIHIELTGVGAGYERGTTIAFALSYRGTDPVVVAGVANALAEFYISENREAREKQATGASGFLEAQLSELKETMDERGRRIDEFRQRHLGGLPEQIGTNMTTLDRLNGALQRNRDRQRYLEERRGTALAPGVAEAGRPGEPPAERLERLNGELVRLRTRYSDAYPDVVALQAEIASVAAEAARAGSGGPGGGAYASPEAERQALQSDERRLLSQIAAYEGRVEQAPRYEAELQQLTRDFEAAKESYDALRKRDDDARLAARLEKDQMGEQFRILDPAIVPKSPAAPNRRNLLLAGLLAAVGAAVVAIALKEQSDSSFHTADALRALTTVPVLTSIPRIVTRRDKWRGAFRTVWLTALAGVWVALVGCGAWIFAHGNEGLVTLLARGSR